MSADQRKRRKREAARLYLDGVPVREIAEMLGVGPTTIQNDIKSEGIAMRSNRWDKYREEVMKGRMERAVRLHEDGRSWTEIGRALGVSKATVQSYFKKLGIKPKYNSTPRQLASDPEQLERIRVLHTEHGWTCQEIGWMLGLSPSGVGSRLRSAGVQLRGYEIHLDRIYIGINKRRERVRYFYEKKGETLGFIRYNLDIGKQTILRDIRAIKRAGAKRPEGWRHPWRVAAERSIRQAQFRKAQRAERIRRRVEARRVQQDI